MKVKRMEGKAMDKEAASTSTDEGRMAQENDGVNKTRTHQPFRFS